MAVGLLAAAACSSSSNEVEPIGPISSNPTASTTTAPIATGVTPRPTSSPPLPTTTPATTSTTTLESLRQQIEADLNASRQALLAAAAQPNEMSSLANRYTGSALADVTALLEQLVAERWAVRPGPSDRISVESVTAAGAEMLVVYCLSSDSVVYEVGSGTIVNDEVVSSRRSGIVTQLGDRWVLSSAAVLSTRTGPACG